jgi:hypothetical protein
VRRIIGLAAVAIALLGTVAPAQAWGGPRVRVFVGPGFWWGPPVVARPFWYGYPYYAGYYPPPYAYPPAYAPPVVLPQSPPVYVQQEASPGQPQYYWYYCEAAEAYYPYARQCPGGWTKVVPPSTPPGETAPGARRE